MEIKSSKIFGIRAIIEVINSDATLQKVYLQDNLTSVLSGLIKKLPNKIGGFFFAQPFHKKSLTFIT
jgi:hypothetical protein